MESVETILLMLVAVCVSGYIKRAIPLNIPLPLVQIVLGILVSLIGTTNIDLDPQIFFLLFLPPLLFMDGWRIPKDTLFRDWVVVLLLALGLVIFTVIGAGYFINWLIPSIPLAAAFALAAILSPTDPVAVTSIASKLPIPERMMTIIEGESLLNDASGLVCFAFAIAAVSTGTFSLPDALLKFSWVSVVGILVGVLVTFVITATTLLLTRKLGEEGGTSVLINLLTPFGAYLLAEYAGASGILAAVAAGITMSFLELRGDALPVTRITRAAVWDTVTFPLNGIIFVLLGVQLPMIVERAVQVVVQLGGTPAWWLVVYTLGIGCVLLLLRFVWVAAIFWRHLFKNKDNYAPENNALRLISAMTFAGVRGAVTLAGILTLPYVLDNGTPFPARDLMIFLAAMVILWSLVAASIGMPLALKGVKLPPDSVHKRIEQAALREAANAAILAVEEKRHALTISNAQDAAIINNAANKVLANYQSFISATDDDTIIPENFNKEEQTTTTLRLVGLKAERDTLFRLARARRISDDVSRKLVGRIDLIESRLQLPEN